MPRRVLVKGAAGSGTSTLARAVANRIGATFLEADDFFWLPGDPPYRQAREASQRRELLAHRLQDDRGVVVAGSVMGWGAEVEDVYDLVVFLVVPTPERVRRLEAREMARHGRVNDEFIAWAAQYDEGRLPGRSRLRHEDWLSRRTWPVMRIEGCVAIDKAVRDVEIVLEAIAAMERTGEPLPRRRVYVGSFGDKQEFADPLIELVRGGKKRASASLAWSWEAEGASYPHPGDIEVMADAGGKLACIVRFESVCIVPFDEVDAAFAAEEGEGDGSLRYWREAHQAFFADECARLGRAAATDMPVVCATFSLLQAL